MNYIFGSFVRELEYQGIIPKQSDLDRIEDMSDILVGFEGSNENINVTDIDYSVEPGVCKIIVQCPEIVIKYQEDRDLYDVIEMADKFEFRQVAGEGEGEIQLTLTINV